MVRGIAARCSNSHSALNANMKPLGTGLMSAVEMNSSSVTKPGFREGAPIAVSIWLYSVALLVFAMVIVGGATRLTDSGLSITEWQPLLGAIPPFSEADWHVAFEKYRQIPQYQLVNRGMSLGEFKAIYWWEWAHRFLGRFIGVAFLIPFLFFWLSGKISRNLVGKLAFLFLLGGAQGALGWYMVQSGLSERIDVSQYRLAAHLGLAVLIFAAILWVAFGLRRPGHLVGSVSQPSMSGATGAAFLVFLIYLQIILGGFVAGTNAGLSHNSWPLMDGAFIPGGLNVMQPWYLNLFENVQTIQFNHRMLAYGIVLLALIHLAMLWRSAESRHVNGGVLLLAAIIGQGVLGVVTLLSHVAIAPALLHQGGAILLLTLALYHLHCLLGPAQRHIKAR